MLRKIKVNKNYYFIIDTAAKPFVVGNYIDGVLSIKKDGKYIPCEEQINSIDEAIKFLQPVPVPDNWVCYECEAPVRDGESWCDKCLKDINKGIREIYGDC